MNKKPKCEKHCEWKIAFRQQCAEDGHMIEMLDRENKKLQNDIEAFRSLKSDALVLANILNRLDGMVALQGYYFIADKIIRDVINRILENE